MPECPICGEELSWDIDTINGSTCEEYEECPNSHYSYEFAYGSTRYYIGESVVSYNYLDSKKSKETLLKIIKESIKKEKERWDA
ncbi:MAG: hypothetical protein ACOCRK_11565 [bacterium]